MTLNWTDFQARDSAQHTPFSRAPSWCRFRMCSQNRRWSVPDMLRGPGIEPWKVTPFTAQVPCQISPCPAEGEAVCFPRKVSLPPFGLDLGTGRLEPWEGKEAGWGLKQTGLSPVTKSCHQNWVCSTHLVSGSRGGRRLQSILHENEACFFPPWLAFLLRPSYLLCLLIIKYCPWCLVYLGNVLLDTDEWIFFIDLLHW